MRGVDNWQCFGWGMLGRGMLVIAITFVLVSVGSRNSELNPSLANVERAKTSQLLQCNGSNFPVSKQDWLCN